MSMKKFTAVLLIFAVAALFVFAGCQKNQNVNDNETTQEQSDATIKEPVDKTKPEVTGQQEDVFPLTITDAHGTEMTLPEKPQKIASISLVSDEMLFSLVDADRIAATTHLAIDDGISNVADEAKDITLRLNQSDTEKIIALGPDLVIVSSWTDSTFIQQLRDAKIVVYAMETADDIEHLNGIVKKIALLVGESAKGEELLSWMDEKLTTIEDKVSLLKDDEKKSVLFCDAFWSTYGKGTTSDDIASRAGLINVASRAGIEGWSQVSKESIISWNPDIIFLPAWSYDGKFDPEDFKKKIVEDESLKSVNAVKNGRVYLLEDKHMTSTSQYMVLGVEDAAKTAYPELFK